MNPRLLQLHVTVSLSKGKVCGWVCVSVVRQNISHTGSNLFFCLCCRLKNITNVRAKASLQTFTKTPRVDQSTAENSPRQIHFTPVFTVCFKNYIVQLFYGIMNLSLKMKLYIFWFFLHVRTLKTGKS